MDRMKAEKNLTALKRHWFQKRKNLMTMMREVATKEESQLESSDATNKASEVEEVLALLGEDEAAVGHLTMSVQVMAETEEAALAEARLVQEVTDGLGWVTEVESQRPAKLARQSAVARIRRRASADDELAKPLRRRSVGPGVAWRYLERAPCRPVPAAASPQQRRRRLP